MLDRINNRDTEGAISFWGLGIYSNSLMSVNHNPETMSLPQ